MAMTLPKFTMHAGHDKLEPATEEDTRKFRLQAIARIALDEAAQRKGGPQNVTVLDFGCGRGLTVAVLRRMGFRAYGVDVVESYVRNSAGILGLSQADWPLASLLDSGGKSAFPNHFFDVVISDQVFEHIADLNAAVNEISRVTAPDGIGVHVFPAQFCLVEPHLYMPLVHWLPKGKIRFAAIATLLWFGIGAKHFSNYTLSERVQIFSQYSDDETFYRPLGEIRNIFALNGLQVKSGAREKLVARGGLVGRFALWPIIGNFGGWLYGKFWAMAITTRAPP